MIDHLNTFPERQREIHEMREVIFGNNRTGEKGMKQKVDEMHEILTRAKGIPWLLGVLILMGGALAVLKGWLMRI